jgi:hypothetical protein
MGSVTRLLHNDDAHCHLLKKSKLIIVLQLKHRPELIKNQPAKKAQTTPNSHQSNLLVRRQPAWHHIA